MISGVFRRFIKNDFVRCIGSKFFYAACALQCTVFRASDELEGFYSYAVFCFEKLTKIDIFLTGGGIFGGCVTETYKSGGNENGTRSHDRMPY